MKTCDTSVASAGCRSASRWGWRGTAAFVVVLVLILAAGCLALGGCGSTSDSSASTSGNSATTAAGSEGQGSNTTVAGDSGAAAGTPEEIGDQVVVLYRDSMNGVVALMEPKPDAATLRPQVEQLKAEYVDPTAKRRILPKIEISAP